MAITASLRRAGYRVSAKPSARRCQFCTKCGTTTVDHVSRCYRAYTKDGFAARISPLGKCRCFQAALRA